MGLIRRIAHALGSRAARKAPASAVAGDTASVVAPWQTTVSTHFELAAHTSWGDTMVIVGAAEHLGAWQVERGWSLGSTEYPMWALSLELPAGLESEFKFVRRRADGRLDWEAGPNRVLVARDGHRLRDEFRDPTPES